MEYAAERNHQSSWLFTSSISRSSANQLVVINGEKETGVTTFKLKHEIDTGDILLQESFPIGENETAGEVHDRMKEIGARLLVKTVQGIVDER